MKLIKALLLTMWVMCLPFELWADDKPAAAPVSSSAVTVPSAEDNRTATQVLKDVSDKLIARLNKDKVAIKKDPFVIIDIVDTIIMPVTDFNLIAKRVLGQNWVHATPAQQQLFLKEFKLLLIVTYIAAFRSYENQSVDFKRELPSQNDKDRVLVQTLIQQPGSPPIPVNYSMHKVDDPKSEGKYRWVVYDFNVDGVGLTSSFRQQFNQAIQEKGMDKMLKDMHDKNESFFGRE
jgi:ABC-type transporter MlaC component